jgi:hypothetical protein
VALFYVRCPVCGTRIPLFGDEPVDPWNVIDCHFCGTSVDYRPEDITPDGRKPPPSPRKPSRNGRPHPPHPPRWRHST